MKTKSALLFLFIMGISIFQLGMSRNPAQYDEEARETERLERQQKKAEAPTTPRNNPVKSVASGIKEATVDTTADAIEGTVEETKTEPPVVGTLEGARKASGKMMQDAVKGAVKVATFGYANPKKIDVEEPEAGSDEVTKYRIGL